MPDAVQQIMPDRRHGAVNMRRLTAAITKITPKRGAAIQAQHMAGVAMSRFASGRFYGPPNQPAGGEVARCFPYPCHADSVANERAERDRMLGRIFAGATLASAVPAASSGRHEQHR